MDAMTWADALIAASSTADSKRLASDAPPGAGAALFQRLAVAVGAVKTVVVKNKKTIGTNTDVAGFYENVKPHLSQTKKAVMLGAGGAARGVAVALSQLGFSHIVITNRTREKAEAIAKDQALDVVAWEHRADALKDADLLVNTTSLGLAGQPPLALGRTDASGILVVPAAPPGPSTLPAAMVVAESQEDRAYMPWPEDKARVASRPATSGSL